MFKNNIKNLIKKITCLLVYEIFIIKLNKNTNYVIFNRNYLIRYYKDNHFIKLYNEALFKTNSQARDSFSKQLRYYGLFQMVNYIINNGISGDFVECGCWRGHSAYMIAKLISNSGDLRKFHIFDSFEGGLSEKTKEDKILLAKKDPESIKREKEAFFSTEEEVQKALSEFNFVKLYKGWIPDRFDDVKKNVFSLVNLDLDLYQPIRDSLNFFYPRLSDKGVIIIDDYGTTDWPGVKKAVDLFIEQNKITFAIETTGSIIIIK